MKKLSSNEQIIANDILRYKKNKLASGFALLGLAFNCLYFMLLYAMPRDEFTTISIGFSIILTLAVLLSIFLASEGVKGYNKKYSYVLGVVAVFQILRIFFYPLKAIQNDLFVASDTLHTIGYFGYYPSAEASTAFFSTLMIVYLVLSAACLIFAAVWGYIVAIRLEKFQKQLDNGDINIMTTISELDAEDAKKNTETSSDSPKEVL
jgi:HAMP domain-containing protein